MESTTYNKNLITETINVFREEDGVLLSKEEAVAILDSFAGLYLAFVDDEGKEVGASAGFRSRGSITPTSGHLDK